MPALTDRERSCLLRYCALLADRLDGSLVEVRLFGSAARGDMWPPASPMHSDVDLLVVTNDDVGEAEADALVNETYPFYLESGRQMSPHFFSVRRLADPRDEETVGFLRRIAPDVVVVWPPPKPA